ncbi:hypothetical protein [Candidatus Poriferisodalis sp.]|uniref:hypothetical protein n=1 Tax=Candidatus Poriferisodalis sp. TaxID=3101277 RepID=UPI003C6F6580
MSEAPQEAVTGILHPGTMGVTVGAACSGTVLWASEGRSDATRQRAADAGLVDVGDLASMVATADMVISVCPPHGAEALADTVADAGFAGCYVDANAVSPTTARKIGALFEDFVDGSLIGPPAKEPGTTRLYLSGSHAEGVAARFEGSALEPRVLQGGETGAASALKMAYASWTKGTSALLMSVAALAAAGLPDGFHRAASEVFERLGVFKEARGASVERLIAALLGSPATRADGDEQV